MNLLMIAPLLDSRGILRYFIGAQVDVSGLVKDCTDLEALQRMLEKQEDDDQQAQAEEQKKDEFQELSEMMNMAELETVRRYGGHMHREQVDDRDDISVRGDKYQHRPRLLIKDPSSELYKQLPVSAKANGRLEGVYQNVRCPELVTASTLANSFNTVSARPTISRLTHPLLLSLASSTRHITITLHVPHWWLAASA